MSRHLTSPRLASLAVLALAAAAGAAAAGGPAYAASGNLASTSRICSSAPAPANCLATFQLTVPETITVTVDKLSSSTQLYTWTITDAHRIVRCRQTYRPADPPESWLCTLPAGWSTFSTPAADGPTAVTLAY